MNELKLVEGQNVNIREENWQKLKYMGLEFAEYLENVSVCTSYK
jgi:hypothetical protein